MSSSRLGDTIGAGRIHFPASSDSNMMYEPFHHFTRSAKSSFEYDGGVPLLAGKVSIKILAKMAIDKAKMRTSAIMVELAQLDYKCSVFLRPTATMAQLKGVRLRLDHHSSKSCGLTAGKNNET